MTMGSCLILSVAMGLSDNDNDGKNKVIGLHWTAKSPFGGDKAM